MKQCDWCQSSFMPTVGYQIYCSESCRVDATKHNQKLKRKTKPKRKGRICANSDCNNILSSYNDSKYCSNCFFSEHLILKELNRIRKHAKSSQNNFDKTT